jgi:hypothetical protein
VKGSFAGCHWGMASRFTATSALKRLRRVAGSFIHEPSEKAARAASSSPMAS